MRSFCRKSHVRKIPLFGGGCFGGGGEVPILFLWARGFFWLVASFLGGTPMRVLQSRYSIAIVYRLMFFWDRTITRLTRVHGLSAGFFPALFRPKHRKKCRKWPEMAPFFSVRKPGCAKLWWYSHLIFLYWSASCYTPQGSPKSGYHKIMLYACY